MSFHSKNMILSYVGILRRIVSNAFDCFPKRAACEPHEVSNAGVQGNNTKKDAGPSYDEEDQ